MLNLKRVDNMDILTRDVPRLVDFYTEVLGLRFSLPYVPEEEWAAIDLGNLTLFVFKTERGENPPRRTAVNLEDDPGMDSFAFEVDDLDAAVASSTAASSGRRTSRSAGSTRAAPPTATGRSSTRTATCSTSPSPTR